MEYVAKFIIVVFIITLFIAVLYKLMVVIARFVIEQIEHYVDRKNAHIIQAEIENTQKLLRDLNMESIPLDEVRESGGNFTTII